jgi:hypothetical protein
MGLFYDFWGTVSAFILGIAPSVVNRVLVSLGLGSVTFVSLSSLVDQLSDQVHSGFGSVSPAVLELINMCGFGTAVNIIFSALVSKTSMQALKAILPI